MAVVSRTDSWGPRASLYSVGVGVATLVAAENVLRSNAGDACASSKSPFTLPAHWWLTGGGVVGADSQLLHKMPCCR